jgi:hypothetical protein
MSDLTDFFKLMAEGKKTDPVAVKAREIKENIQGDLGSLFSEMSHMKGQDPKASKAKQVKLHVKQVIQNDLGSLFAELAALKNKKEEIIEQYPEIIEVVQQIEEPIVEDIVPADIPALISQELAPEAPDPFKNVKKYLGNAKPTHIDPQLDPVAHEFKAVTEKIRFLEQSITKIVNTGPGSGEVNFRYLDDVDRSTIMDGNFLTYNADTKKFEFREVTGGSGGVAQVNSDWNATTGKAVILNKPTLFSGSYTDLTSKPTLFSGSYTDLTSKPTLFSGSYTDLTSKPTLFSGSYTDLTNKPTIPAAQIQSDWTQTNNTLLDYIKNKPTLATVATTGSYTDLSNKPSIPSLTGYATESYVTTQITNLINGAPGTLDTLKEIADQLAADESAFSALTSTVASKIGLTSLSVSTTTASGGGSLAYNNTSGVFTFAPASLPTVNDSTITITAGTGLSGGGTFTLNQSGTTTVTLASTITQYTDSLARASLSVSTASASGGGSLSYNNTSGVFTFTPPSLSSYLTAAVTSVSGTGTVNGITLSGTVTSTGNITLGGTLGNIANSQLSNSTISGIALGSNLNSLTAGTGISFSSGTTYNGSAAITINNSGVTSLTTSSGLSTNTSATGAVSITNTGVTSIVAGTGISISGGTGEVTVSASGSPTYTTVTTGDLIVTSQIVETFSTYSTSIGATAVTLDCASGNIFNITSTVSQNWTAAFTNLTIITGQATNTTLIINQGVTPYVPTALTVNGTSVTINWQGGGAPTGTASKKDVIAFSILQTAATPTFLVFGQLVSFG